MVIKDIGLIKLPYWIKIIDLINNSSAARVSKKTGITYLHTRKIVALFLELKYISKSALNGREQMYILTKKGIDIQNTCRVLVSQLGN
jgi:predicted transcriptional regulator